MDGLDFGGQACESLDHQDVFRQGPHDGMGPADPHDALIESLTESLTVAHVANGMDPLEAVLQARLQAPLIQPLF